MTGIVTGNDTGIVAELILRGKCMADSTSYTIADVARIAGVSVSTVSRSLNGKQDVAPATRERVQQVITELGFKPHAQAKGLRAGKTRNIALLFPLKSVGDVSYNALEVEFILGAAAAAAQREFLFSLLSTQVTKDSLVNFYRSAQVDGLVLMHIYQEDWRVELLRNTGYPFVMIGHCEDNAGLNYIDFDFKGAVITAFDHLAQLGHRHIGFLGLPTELRQSGYGPAARGWEGYQQTLSNHDLVSVYREVSYNAQDIFNATLDLLTDDLELSAIVTTHEFAALSILQALKERGREVPNDCSIVAIMTERIAEVMTPPMTHIDFPAYRMGFDALEMLIRLVEGELDEEQQILIGPDLIVRSSTAPVR